MDKQIALFSPYLFWDTDCEQLDMEAHADYIIKRVLEYGQLKDWQAIEDYYGLSQIVERAKRFRELDKKALSYLVAISHTPIEQFRCYTTQQSNLPHWTY